MVEEMDMGKAATRGLAVQDEAPAFTPGPWAVYRASVTYPPETGLPPGTRVMIGIGDADAGGVTDANFALWRSGPELEANARLIAAAPEIYEALKECADGLAEYVEAYYEKTKEYPSERRRYERDIEPVLKARAALAKATGQPRAAANPLIPPTGE